MFLSGGIYVAGSHYLDVEQAYQYLKDSSEAETKPSKENSDNYELMVDLIAIKFETYPLLMDEINANGGLELLENIIHNTSSRGSIWECNGGGWFKSAIIAAYKTAII